MSLASALSRPVDTAPHLIVEARAGTGKTTTLVEGLKYVLGGKSDMIPSPQQQAVWESMALSAGVAKSIGFVAFNKSIAMELQRRVPQGVDAMTMHSMGFKAVTKALGRKEPTQWAVQDLICDELGMSSQDARKNKFDLLKATEELVGLCKVNLMEATTDNLDMLVGHFDVDTGGCRAEVYAMVPKILERCKTPRNKITFDDMIWLPVVLNLPMFRYDLLLVDEAQDLNRCQQALAKRAGKRLILCGDPKQAIYGFAGADSKSMARMEEELGHRLAYNGDDTNPEFAPAERGCITLPLTVTRRCGKAIVTEANKIVPDFSAHETCPKGAVYRAKFKGTDVPLNPAMAQATVMERAIARTDEQKKTASYHDLVGGGDMVLCRVNAPLVSQCFKFIRAGRKANIQGRDVGAGLISTVKKLKAENVANLIAKLGDWLAGEEKKEQAKRNPSEARMIALQDRHDCLICFTEQLKPSDSVDEVVRKIESLFTDNKDVAGIRLSSIHKAKGLEAKRVFILQPKGAECPHPMARSEWQREQEFNLLYVAITRAIEELVYVS